MRRSSLFLDLRRPDGPRFVRLASEHPKAPRQSNADAQRHPTFPIVFCWFKGKPALYIQTDASDPTVALQQDVNYVPILSNAINANPGAVDDIYVVTNYKQGNVIPSAPIPAGPKNTDKSYTPLWQVSTVTWKAGTTTPHTLKSEEEVLAAARAGFVTITKTNIVVNCPVIFTPEGGKLPTVKIRPDN